MEQVGVLGVEAGEGGGAGDLEELGAEACDLRAELDSEARVVGLVRRQLVGGLVEGDEGGTCQ